MGAESISNGGEAIPEYEGQVFDSVCEILVEVFPGADPEHISAETSLEVDYEADSLDKVELVQALEDKFEISVGQTQEDKDAVAAIDKVGQIVDFVNSKLPEDSPFRD